METSLQKITTLPTIAELFEDNLDVAFKNEKLNTLLNAEPKPSWVLTHPFIRGYRYLPIDKIEFMLRKIFKQYSIEITGQGTAFNGVWVTVRVHYFNPATEKMEFHDGIGAAQLQTKKDTSPADLANINNGAISMAFPIAKTIAIKDACDHFGNVFGANLNRKDTIEFTPDSELVDTISVGMITHLENLINNSSLDEDAKCKLEGELNDMTNAEANKAMAFLMRHQLDAMTHGSHTNQTMIKNKLAEIE
jgi:hypothetical protein